MCVLIKHKATLAGDDSLVELKIMNLSVLTYNFLELIFEALLFIPVVIYIAQTLVLAILQW